MSETLHKSERRPRGLLIVPIVPAPTGNGLAMRAGLTVRGLARALDLSVAVVPVANSVTPAASLAWLRQYVQACDIVPLPSPTVAARLWLGEPAARAILPTVQPLPRRARLACPGLIAGPQPGTYFDLVWTTRLYLAGCALCFRDTTSRLVLDADEDDAETLRQIAELHRQRGEVEAAVEAAGDADAYARMAEACLPWFDRLLTASDVETERFRGRHGTISTLPNAIALPPSTPRVPGSGLLLVGNFDYLPNRDAATRLAMHILPRLRQRYGEAELHLVGAGEAIQSLADLPGVRVHGLVPDLAPFYRSARLALIPLRAGGGSRLKLLEAFAHGVPVVATPVAAEGLAVAHDRELLLADDDDDLVAAAARVFADAAMAAGLAERARHFVATQHDAETIAARIERLAYDEMRAGQTRATKRT